VTRLSPAAAAVCKKATTSQKAKKKSRICQNPSLFVVALDHFGLFHFEARRLLRTHPLIVLKAPARPIFTSRP
jgi:hypothetical protein